MATTIKLDPAESLLNEQEAAALLGVAEATLQAWRTRRRYALPYYRVGRLIRYRRIDIDQWLRSRAGGRHPHD